MYSSDSVQKFIERLEGEWLSPFCQAHGYSQEGFDDYGITKLCESDAADFIRSIDASLVTHYEGFFLAPRSTAKEQIFWQGVKTSKPRRLTLWIEPIITIGALARLHFEHKWPSNLLGLQSKTWAFDLVGHSEDDINSESLLCEVKKSSKELDKLIEFIFKHLNSAPNIESSLSGPELNAFRKSLALRDSNALVFWALGPDRYERIFTIDKRHNGKISLHEGDRRLLDVPNNPFKPASLRVVA